MSSYIIAIPERLLEKAQRVAQQTSRRVDDVILTTLQGALDQPSFDLPEAERAELMAMAYLSDDALLTIAREQLPRIAQERTETLMERNSFGLLSETERRELVAIVERGDKLTLRKAQAIRYLNERGIHVTLNDLKPADE